MQTMGSGLKILHLEDDPEDAEIVQHLLSKEIPGCEFHTVSYKDEFIRVIETIHPEIILSDNQLPRFNATEALSIHRELGLTIPFILVTGTVSEEFAASILRAGADDYILKDRLSRLPGAIYAALQKRKNQKEIRDYKYALDQSSIVSITDSDGVITYVNDNFSRRSKYSKEELIGQNIRLLNSGFHPPEYFAELWATIRAGRIWKGEFRNKDKDGEFYWVYATIVPFTDADGNPFQYLSIRNDITNKKKLEDDIVHQKIQEQKTVARAILRAQESERNYLGQELHDNVNQILVSARLLLEYAHPDAGEAKDMVSKVMNLVDSSINEIRQLSSRQVTPTKNINLKELLTSLMGSLTSKRMTEAVMNFELNDHEVNDELKLNIYRIVQELVNNIIKHADATKVELDVHTEARTVYISMEDNGKGFNMHLKRSGIGISNLHNRVESFNGEIEILSGPGKGCRVDISIPF